MPSGRGSLDEGEAADGRLPRGDYHEEEGFDSDEYREFLRSRRERGQRRDGRQRDDSDEDKGYNKSGSTNPPEWDGTSIPFQDWLIKARLWVTTTRVKPQYQGPLILSKLSGPAFQAFKHWSKDEEWLNAKDGGTRLLQAMDRPEYFGEDKEEEMIASMARLTYHIRRHKDEGHRAFFNRWEEAYRKIQEHGIDLPDRYLGFLMINSLGLDENTIKSLLTYTHGSITTKDVKEWTRKFESKLLARDVGTEKRSSTTSTRSTAAAHYQLDEDTEIYQPGQDDDELHLVEAALDDLQSAGGDGKPTEDEEGEELALEEHETAEILNTMLAQKKKTFTQSVRLKKAKDLARGYSDWKSKGSSSSSSNNAKGRGKNGMSVDELKAITRCAKCKKVGHWHRECPENKGKGKEVYFLEPSGGDFEEASFCGLLEFEKDYHADIPEAKDNHPLDYKEEKTENVTEIKTEQPMDYLVEPATYPETDPAENLGLGEAATDMLKKTDCSEPPTEPICRHQEQTGHGEIFEENLKGELPGFGSYKVHHTGLYDRTLKETDSEVLWTDADLSRRRTGGAQATRPRTWRDPQPEIDERCCATLDTGCQRMAVGRDTLSSLSQAMPQELTIGTIPQEHRFRSVHGRSSTSRVAIIPTSLGHKGSVLRPAIFEESGSRGAPFLISLPFMMFCRSVLHLDPEDGLRIYFRKFKFSIRCHLGPTGALRIPLNHFTPEQLQSVQNAQRSFQETHNEFEVYKMSECVAEPSGSKQEQPEVPNHGAYNPHGDRQQAGTTGRADESRLAGSMDEDGTEATLRGTLHHAARTGHPRGQDTQDPATGDGDGGVDGPNQGSVQRLWAESTPARNLGGSSGIHGQLGDGGVRGVLHTVESTDDTELLAGQDRRHPRGAARPEDEGESRTTSDVRTRRAMPTHEGQDDRRIGRSTLLEMRPATGKEMQGLRMVQIPTMDGHDKHIENSEPLRQGFVGGETHAHGVHILRGGPMRPQAHHHPGIEQLHLQGEVQGLWQTSEGREALSEFLKVKAKANPQPTSKSMPRSATTREDTSREEFEAFQRWRESQQPSQASSSSQRNRK